MLGQPDTNPYEKHELDEQWRTVKRRHRFLAAGWLLLASAFIGGAWYAYPVLDHHEAAIAKLASAQKGVETISDRVKQTQAKLEDWATDQQGLRDQMKSLGQKMQTKVETAAKQAQDSTAAVYRRVQAQIDERLQSVQTRLTHLESSSDNQQTRVAELQRELEQTRSEMSKQTDQIAAVRSQIDANGAAHDRQFAQLQRGEDTNRRDVAAVERKLAVHRVDFEVTKNHSRELAEGISLGVTNTDVAHRYVSGWLWVMPDRRTIWLKNQNASQSVVFYGTTDSKKRELVITNVARGSVIGYLLLPGESGDDNKQVASIQTSGK
jgi:predicted  nucleic acid-binding Zn-ribbon protein